MIIFVSARYDTIKFNNLKQLLKNLRVSTREDGKYTLMLLLHCKYCNL